LLIYEAWIVIGSVLLPLIANPRAVQTDFHYYYDAAVRFSNDRRLLYRATDDVIAGFAYPPPAIVPFLALARLPLGIALLVMTVATYAVLALLLRMWVRYLRRHGFTFDRRTALLVALIAFASGPVYMNAVFGQVNVFVLASSVAFVNFFTTAPVLAGAFLAMGMWLKIYPALVSVLVIWDRRTWRALAWTFVCAALVLVILLPIVPIASYRSFLSDVLAVRADKTALHIVNQSLVACLERFRYPSEEFLNWTGHEAVTVSVLAGAINACAGIASILFLWKNYGSLRPVESAAGLMALVAVLAPLGWGHTYVMVLPLVVLRLIEMVDARPVVAMVIFLAVCALMIPAGRHLPMDAAPDWLENLVYSRYLFATIALICIRLTCVSTSRGRDTSTPSSNPPRPAP
jgi:alpha-1,2-mannosyltransferase